MPKLRHVRLVNAQFDDGKSIYEDFRMPFYGRNATYELRNGGGKSVLLMLMLQCVLPNTSLDTNHPFKDMFRGGDPNRTTHVLAEWELEEGIAEKKYLLTGFCAKRRSDQDEGEKNDGIKYFSYIHLYNEPNDLDLESIPLCRKERSGLDVRDYTDTLKMLREKAKAGYDIRVTETRREYLETIQTYCLLEPEWEFIKQINKQENFLKSYFREFRSSRTLVERLLIKTIERCLHNKQSLRTREEIEESSAKSLADALYQSQEELKRLQEEQKCLYDYDRILKGITYLQETNLELIGSFLAFEGSKQLAASQHAAHRVAVAQKEEMIRRLQERVTEKEASLHSINHKIKGTKLVIQNIHVNLLKQELEEAGEEKTRLDHLMKAQEHKVRFAWAVNKYLRYREFQAEVRRNEEFIENTTRDYQEVFSRLHSLGKTLFAHSVQERQRVTETLRRGEGEADALKEANKKCEQDLGGIKVQIENNKREIADLERQITCLEEEEADLRRKHERCPGVDSGLSDHTPTLIEATEKRIMSENDACALLSAEIDERKRRLSRNEGSEEGLREQMASLEGTISRLKGEVGLYTAEEHEAHQIAALYGMDEIEPCRTHLKDRINALQESLVDLKIRRTSLAGELEGVQNYGVALNRDTLDTLKILREKYPEVRSGAEYLKSLPDEKREKDLANAPWLSKTILLLPGDYETIVHSPSVLPARVQDASVIITSYDHLRDKRRLTLGDVYIPSRPPEYTFRILGSDREAERLRREIARTDDECGRVNEMLKGVRKDEEVLTAFVLRFPPGYREKKEAEIQGSAETRDGKIARHAAVQKEIDDDRNTLPELQAQLERKREETSRFEKKRLLLINILEISRKKKDASNHLQQKFQYGKEYEVAQQQTEVRIVQGTLDLNEKEQSNGQMKDYLRRVEKECAEYREYENEKVDLLSATDISGLKTDYWAAKEVVDGVNKNIGHVREMIARDRRQAEEARADIETVEISIAEIEARDPREPIPDETIEMLKEGVQALRNPLEKATERYGAVERDYRFKFHILEKAEEDFNGHAPEPYVRDPGLLDASPFEADLDRLQDSCVVTHDEIASLRGVCDKAESQQRDLEKQYLGYEMLDSTYHFVEGNPLPAEDLIPYGSLQKELASNDMRVTKSRKKLETTKEEVIGDLTGVTTAVEFIDVIQGRLRVAETLDGAYSISQSLNSYAATIREKISIIQEMVDGLLKVETKIVAQALGIAVQYRDYLKRFPAASKIEIEDRTYEMVHINFNICAYADDVAKGRMHEYIQDLTHHIQIGKISREELEKALMPEQLVGRVLDMGQIVVKIRKVDKNTHLLQQWDQIKASDGQENMMYIIFLVVIMSAIREIVVDRYDMKTAKVLIVDNPFGSTGAHYLWEKIGSILERNNVQLICSGHNIGADVREFFPVNHILTEEMSTSGRTRIGIRFEGAGKELDRLERQKWRDITAWI